MWAREQILSHEKIMDVKTDYKKKNHNSWKKGVKWSFSSWNEQQMTISATTICLMLLFVLTGVGDLASLYCRVAACFWGCFSCPDAPVF